ncbi:HIT family protein, partial [Escherichia coli]|nr:HIT family protein [Escherichia coli]
LVIPKHAEARNLLEIDAQNLAKVMAVVQRLTRALVEEVQPDGVQIAQFNG